MKILYSKLIRPYNSTTGKSIRLLLYLILILFISAGILAGNFPNFSLFFASAFFCFEIFFYFKIFRFTPKFNVSSSFSDPYDTFTLEALSCIRGNIKKVMSHLITSPGVLFFLEKAGLKPAELKMADIEFQNLIEQAVDMTKKTGGKYVTAYDLIASYLLSTEDNTKLMFGKKLKKDELLNILLWTRGVFAESEAKVPIRIRFNQKGIGEVLAEGWTYETQKYMKELNVLDFKKSSQIVGREKEYKEVLDALFEKKGVLLVGEAGSGRTAMLDKLSLSLSHKRFFELLLDTILAGAQNAGAIEERFNNIIEEVTHSGNAVLVIDNFENIAGASSFKINLLDTLIPYVKKGKIATVGLITPGAFKKYIEPFKDLLEIFEIVKFSELDEKTTLYVLFSKTAFIEEKYKVTITYKALKASVAYAKNYMPQVFLPGAAVSLLGDTAASASLSKKKTIEEEDINKKVEEKSHIPISPPKEDEKKLLLSIESELHKRIVSQDEAISAVSEALRRVRTGMVQRTKPISFLFLGPTGVGKTETAKSLAEVYFKSETRMLRFDMSEYSAPESLGRLLGEGEQKGELTEIVYENPFSLVLLDEFEKANPAVLNLFLQILDDGRVTDNFGKTVSFINTIIIATSNAGSEFIREEVAKGSLTQQSFKEKLLEFLETKGIFSPELLNRFDGVVVFKPLNRDEIKSVVKMMLYEFIERMEEKDIKVRFMESVIDKIASEGFNEQFGARPIRRYIQDNIEDLVAQKILKDEVKRGSSVTVSLSPSGNITM